MNGQKKPKSVSATIVRKQTDSFGLSPNLSLDSNLYGLPIVRIKGFFFILDNGREQIVSQEEYTFYQIGDEYTYEEAEESLTALWVGIVLILILFVIVVITILALLPVH